MGQLVFQATLGGQVALVGPNTASTININIPATNGNMVTTGDTGTVTNTMLASSAYAIPGTIGSTTPNTGSFTTLTATTSNQTNETISGNLTLSGGTANGVLYLNGSKVATSGSALTYDGTTFGVNGIGLFNNSTGYLRVAVTGSPSSGSAALQIAVNSTNARTIRMENTLSGGHTYDIINGAGGVAGNWGIYDDTAGAYRLTLDSSGNLGLGVTPSAWDTGGSTKAIQISTLTTVAQAYGGTYIGNNWFYAVGADKYLQNGYATRYGQDGSGKHIWYNAPSGTAGNPITFTQAMTLDASGNLLVGGTTALQKITVTGSVGATSHFIPYSGSTVLGYIGNDNPISGGSGSNIGLRAESAMLFATGGSTERMRIDSSGNLLVGTTSAPANRLYVQDTRTDTNRTAIIYNAGNTSGNQCLGVSLGSNTNNTSSYFVVANGAGADRLYIYGNGNIVNLNNSYGALSDITIKENVIDTTPKLEDLCKVKVRNYNLIADESKTKQIGVVAQELEEVFPSMVEIDGISGHKQVKYSVFVPMLIKAIQELKAEVDSLKAQLNK